MRRATPSRIRFRHQAPQYDPRTEVHRARARRDRALPATSHHRVGHDRRARDSGTTPQVRRGAVVVARVRVAPVHHSLQLLEPQRSPATLGLARVECQLVVARLQRVGEDPLLVLRANMAGRVHVQDRRHKARSMLRGRRALLRRRGGRTTNRRRVRRRSRRPPQRGLAASTAARALALSLYQSASI